MNRNEDTTIDIPVLLSQLPQCLSPLLPRGRSAESGRAGAEVQSEQLLSGPPAPIEVPGGQGREREKEKEEEGGRGKGEGGGGGRGKT